MKVKVLYFAALRERLGTPGEEVELPAAGATLGAVREQLRARGGRYAEAFSEKALVRMAVNQEMAPASTPVRAGDEVAFFPPVTGG